MGRWVCYEPDADTLTDINARPQARVAGWVMIGDFEADRAATYWTFASFLGALIGATAALALFPSAGFDRDPTSEFNSVLLWFDFTVGFCFAVAQGLVLVNVTKPKAKLVLFVLWVAASTAGVVLMLIPLWVIDAMWFAFAPYAAFWPLLPGMIALALLQWLILYACFSASPWWIARTVFGGAIGAVLGLVVYYLSGTEIIWVAMTGGSIGFLQAGEFEIIVAERGVR